MKLSPLELDALSEVFNHGVGQAAFALSELAGEEVQLSAPKIEELSKRSITPCGRVFQGSSIRTLC